MSLGALDMFKHPIACALVACVLLPTPIAHAQAQGETVRIQDYPGPGNMLYRVAVAKGYCEKYGIKCRLQMIPAAPLGIQALLAKSIDVTMGPIEVQVNAMVKGAAIKAFSGAQALNPFLLVVRNDIATANSEKGFRLAWQHCA